MTPPAGDGRSPAPIDRPVLEFLQTRLQATAQVARATITDASGHLELRVILAPSYYPEPVEEVTLTVRWYTNDDFKIQYQEVHPDHAWECRWDRHPNSHNTRDHFHPPSTAPTLGEDESWPSDHRDVLRLVLNAVEERITKL
ncbi:hypothetical protein [Natrinema versiforme]|uniref:Uncharacterized protein n=1 Tax=Natrinema versiforme TaxID=88724 RepID=A0A4P8WMH6_9EURY|nr:hypothetical protein [Natrinema versiforme]QCS44797.1 hypothetical protein FEJ81_21065 [Natrinema versiforme]